jgi:hypothetical protein
MSKFKIKVARIETVAGAEEDTQVRITFQVDRAAQSQSWKLSAKDLQQLSNMSLRPKA